ncbi:MAG: TrkA C-terminal domain-containing protein, partial [Deltaproteobacteria bacterium]|nr:TrkA C-terminal domain-containing protein [Deltaproteobacteria bacterium]
VDMVRGLDTLELSTILKEGARFFTFTAEKNDSGPIPDLKLPAGARVMFFYRDDKFSFVADDTKLRQGDEVIILTHSDHIQELCERWKPKQASADGN